MPSSNNQRPNIIMIMTDDQGLWSLGCYGNNEIKTPNLDKLAESGWLFKNFFCVSPVCSPARASILTGKIPSQHGIHDWICGGDTFNKDLEPLGNGQVIEYLKDHESYSEILAQNGYVCGISGKWHMGNSHKPQKGFSYWNVHAKGGGNYYGAPMVEGDGIRIEDRYITDVFTDNALEFLEQEKANDSPFYLSIHYTAPHSPWSRKNHPEKLWDEYHENCAFESTPNNLKPASWIDKVAIPIHSEDARREALSGYFSAITAMDQNVGRVLSWLEDNNLRDNTLICFTSDNGMNMGHHGVYGKGNATYPMNMYEESVKVPFIMSHPSRLKAGMVCDSLLSHYDFMPTILEYVGLQTNHCSNIPGSSFLPILTGQDCDVRNNVVVFDEYGPVRMIRNDKWKYVHRYPDGPHELYNLENDPGETTNLVDDHSVEDIRIELKQELECWFAKYTDPDLDGRSKAVSGSGQFNWAGKRANSKSSFCQ